MSDRHAQRMMQSAEVVSNLKTGPTGPLPTSERQARPLAKFPVDEQLAAWDEAVATAPAGKVTAKHVSEVVARP